MGFLFLKRQLFLVLSVIFLLALLAVQFTTTKRTNFDRTKLTEMERIEQIRRMNEYPPFAYRLANILEARQEAVTYFKLEKNFVGTFDMAGLFGDLRMFVFFPFFVLGMMWMIKLYPVTVALMSLPPIVLLTVIGHQNLYGSVSLMPVIYSAIVYGIYIVFRKGSNRNEE